MNFVSLLATCLHLTSSSKQGLEPGTVQNTFLAVISQERARRSGNVVGWKEPLMCMITQSLSYQGKSCPKYDNGNYFIIYK